jgi:serine/threonine protein kinase
MTNLVGKSLGHYHILEQLGEGGMATVYKAYDIRLEGEVAVKVIRTERLTFENTHEILKRFEREAKALAHVLKCFEREAKSMTLLTHPKTLFILTITASRLGCNAW